MVHCFKLHGDNVVYDSSGGSLHVCSDAVVGIIGAWSLERGAFDDEKMRGIEAEYGVAETREAAGELLALIADGQLFAPDETEPDMDLLAGTYVFKSLCMHLAHDCNMRCAYCFAAEGSFGQKRELMNYETACAAIDFIIAASANRRNIEIDFFGGEPLLNFDVLKRTVQYARNNEDKRGKKFRFTLTTNGILLNEAIIKYVNANMDNLVLSVDGRREVNDRMRQFPNGAGTYDYIIDRFKAVTEQREASWYIRGTYTAKNKDFSNDVLHLADLGFDRLSVEPVISPPDPGLAFAPGDLTALCEQYEKLAYAMNERAGEDRPFEFFHFNVDLEGGPCTARRIKGCGAGYEYAAVTPAGDIYPCHQFAGDDHFRLGNVREGINEYDKTALFKHSNLYTKSGCVGCWAKFFCGGGCAANAWFYNKDINKPNEFYCALFRKRIECALWLKCAGALGNRE